MVRLLTIGIVIFLTCLFGWGVSIVQLFGAFQSLTVALSIMVAAIFVRLNRGMPTLDWKSLDRDDRSRLTSNFVQITQEYGRIIALYAASLAGIVALTVVGRDEVKGMWPIWAQIGSSAAIGGCIALCACRMGYVVWRDLDIVRLQKHLIDASAAHDAIEGEAKASVDKIRDIRSAGLRKIAVREPKPWGD